MGVRGEDVEDVYKAGYSADARADCDRNRFSPASANSRGNGSATLGKVKSVSSVSFTVLFVDDIVEEENDIFESRIVFKRIASCE